MAKKSFQQFIKEKIRLLDGGMGSMLFRNGFQGGCPEEAPEEIIRKIHTAYLEAGSDIIISNTFGGSRLKLKGYGLEDKVYEINKRNASITSSIKIDKEYYAAGDIGPTGEFMEPFGDYTYEQFYEIFAEQAKALADGGVDLIIVETMMAIDEFKAAVSAAKKETGLPVIGSMAFNKNPNGFFTMGGDTPEKLAEAAIEIGLDAVGANCNLNPADMAELAELFAKVSKIPVFVEPNAGNPKLENGKTVYESVDNLEEHLLRILNSGVRIVGGCCGTDEKYIQTLKKLTDKN